MQIEKRIIFNKVTGTVLNGCLEERYDSGLTEKMINDLRPKEIDYIDLEYGSTVLDNVEEYHVDINTKEIVIDKYKKYTETEDEKLKREKQELENQLLLSENKNLGGIL
ncbi:hypothetical protein EXN65_21800 [Clostridium botulinum]|uniref:Phage protein n=1 Tax=Clostridium botulinum TaxID=1491 RepID=A0A7U2CRV6_CLOBO|nr:hypothetical protein [Clostridium botulinum]ABS32810.1 hypothetical protein CLB_2958 [Clostridium botulinum A str. ATCC 19397]ABS33573.1 hypothetical protein CLB_2434 [Clostridium botulinum A str. ATCC 19397]EDT84677.1 hypothetical protein CBB_1562 [Clostridium botulinum Bf]MBO3438200.1 hypothetical protein [Clostridium botulinum]MBY6757023.1 hypothetical protein [Clostridium botulinum]